jgi:hypothetical protein
MMHKGLDDKTMCSLEVKLELRTTLLEFNISSHASHQPPVANYCIEKRIKKMEREGDFFVKI